MNTTILSRCWMSQGYFHREYRRSVGAMLALVLSRYLIQQGCVYISGRKTTSIPDVSHCIVDFSRHMAKSGPYCNKIWFKGCHDTRHQCRQTQKPARLRLIEKRAAFVHVM